MRVRRAGVGVVAVAVGLMVASCSGTTPGTPSAETSVEDSTVPPSGSDGQAPPVENPKNLQGIDPCELMTPEQLSELGVPEAGTKDESPWGEELCGWDSPVVSMSLSPNTTLGDGLDRAYRNKENFDEFEVSDVDGYPSVRVDFATQSCGLIAGISDEQTLSMEFTRVSPDAPGKGDPCEFAESVMGEIIANLPDA